MNNDAMKNAMFRLLLGSLIITFYGFAGSAWSQMSEKVLDVPTRPGVTDRILILTPPAPKAIAILFPGGHGGLQLDANGNARWGEGNFLMRARRLFADQGIMTAIIDAPSDRQSPPFLAGFRQKKEHVADLKAVMATLKQQANVPVWLVGTSRGTQSVAFIATELIGNEGPQGIVLTSTILSDEKGRPVPDMPLNRITTPVLVVHHESDSCQQSSYGDVSKLMDALHGDPKAQLMTIKGGRNVGDPCEARAYHGYNGLDQEVVTKITSWMLANQ